MRDDELADRCRLKSLVVVIGRSDTNPITSDGYLSLKLYLDRQTLLGMQEQ